MLCQVDQVDIHDFTYIDIHDLLLSNHHTYSTVFDNFLQVYKLFCWWSFEYFLSFHWLPLLAWLLLPCAPVRSWGKTMPSCLCVCRQRNIEKRFKQGSYGISRRYTQEKQPTESHLKVSVPDTSQGGSFRRCFSYFLLSFSWPHPFRNRTLYLHWRSIPWIHSMHSIKYFVLTTKSLHLQVLGLHNRQVTRRCNPFIDVSFDLRLPSSM